LIDRLNGTSGEVFRLMILPVRIARTTVSGAHSADRAASSASKSTAERANRPAPRDTAPRPL
jgi:hypothetical protein